LATTKKASNLKRRVKRLAEGLWSAKLEGIIIPPGPNLTYYTGVRAQLLERPLLLLMTRDGDSHLLAPKLETGPFRGSIHLIVHAWDDTEGPSRALRELLEGIHPKGGGGATGGSRSGSSTTS